MGASRSAQPVDEAEGEDDTPVAIRTATDVTHMSLIQDHLEGGKRIHDVELFTKALQLRRIRHLLEPQDGPHTNFLHYWLSRHYGHLKQGSRLLLSHCDFSELITEDTPLFWRYTLKSLGTMRGLTPALNQEGYLPHIVYHNTKTPAGSEQERTVNPKVVMSLAEVLMEPLFYNPNMQGWWGAALCDSAEWELSHRAANRKPALIRSSGERNQRCKEMFKTATMFAHEGITHLAHLLNGWEAGEEQTRK